MLDVQAVARLAKDEVGADVSRTEPARKPDGSEPDARSVEDDSHVAIVSRHWELGHPEVALVVGKEWRTVVPGPEDRHRAAGDAGQQSPDERPRRLILHAHHLLLDERFDVRLGDLSQRVLLRDVPEQAPIARVDMNAVAVGRRPDDAVAPGGEVGGVPEERTPKI